MVLFVNRDALGVRITGLAQVSFVLFFLIRERLRAIHCWT